jgi:hypothetical protein
MVAAATMSNGFGDSESTVKTKEAAIAVAAKNVTKEATTNTAAEEAATAKVDEEAAVAKAARRPWQRHRLRRP